MDGVFPLRSCRRSSATPKTGDVSPSIHHLILALPSTEVTRQSGSEKISLPENFRDLDIMVERESNSSGRGSDLGGGRVVMASGDRPAGGRSSTTNEQRLQRRSTLPG